MKAFRTIAGVTAASVIALGLLTACTPTTPIPTPTASKTSTPTPTPTPTAVSAPASDTDAIEAGYAVAKEYFRIWDETQSKHPNDMSKLEQIATGTALSTAEATIKNTASQGITVTGSTKYTLISGLSYAAPATDANGAVEAQFGQPILIGCLDYRGITAKKADGSTITLPKAQRKTEVIVRYFTSDARWMVVDYSNAVEGTECES